MNVNIRPATLEDASTITNLFKTSLTLLSKNYATEQINAIADYYDADFYREVMEKNYRLVFVAEAGDRIVGFGSITENGRAIADIFVHPDYTRQGIATLLMANLEQIALNKGVSKLRAMASLYAQPFYTARGFKYEQDSALIDGETGIKFPCVDMAKVLARNSNFKRNNFADGGDLSTLSVPQFLKLSLKILWGSSQ